MITILAALAISAQTKLYTSGCAPLDTASAVVPLVEFRLAIAGLEERQILRQELATCQDLIGVQSRQISQLDQAFVTCSTSTNSWKDAALLADQNRKQLVSQLPRFGFWSGVSTGAFISMLLSLLVVGATR